MSVNYYVMQQAYTPVTYEGFDNAIVIIGHAYKGPSMLPVYFSGTNSVEYIYGPGSELSNAILECFYTGATRVIAFRINGIYASVTLDSKIKLYSINAGDVGGTIKAQVATVEGVKTLTIYEAHGLLEATYVLTNEMSISSLCATINSDASFGLVGIVAEPLVHTAASNTLLDTVAGGVELTGGVDENIVTGATLYERLGAIYSMLETINLDIIIPMPVRYTNSATITTEYSHIPKVKYFYNQLEDFCNIKANGGNPVTAIITADDYDPDVHIDLNGYVNALTIPDKIRRSQYIVVTKSWLATPFYNSDGTRYICNGTATLGGLLSSIDVSVNPVNKPAGVLIGIYNDGTTKYEFNASQIERLANLGICTFHSSIRRGVCLASAITSALPSHPCSSIKNARLASYIVKLVMTMLDGYIGEGMVNQYSSINKVIDTQLKSIQKSNIISDYRYTVTSDQLGSSIGIDIEAVPCNDIKTVSATVMVNL